MSLSLSRRRRLTWCFRVLILALLIAAAFDPSYEVQSPGGVRIYLLDLSQSYRPYLPRALEYIRRTSRQMEDHHQVAVVTFGGNPYLEQSFAPPSSLSRLARLKSAPDSRFTNIERAMAFVEELPRPSGSRQIVLLTDGRETRGQVRDWWSVHGKGLASSVYCPVFAVKSRPRLEILQIVTPPRGRIGEVVSPVIWWRGVEGETYTFTVEGKSFRRSQTVNSDGTEKKLTFSIELKKSGFHRYRLVSAQGKILGRWGIWVEKKNPSILWLRGEGKSLRPRLPSTAIQVVSPGAFPSQSTSLGTYEAVVLDDVPLRSLSSGQWKALIEYVYTLGGGLVVLGGKNSYGPGGYGESELEKALPVWSDPQRRSRRQLSLAVVIDTSGSMGREIRSGLRKIDLALDQIFPLPHLNRRDRLAVIRFSQDVAVIQPFGPSRDSVALVGKLKEVRPQGKTDLPQGLVQTLDLITREKSSLLHIVLISDGQSQNQSSADLARIADLARRKPQLSASIFPVGDGPDRNFLKRVEKALGPRARLYPSIRLKDLGKTLERDMRRLRLDYLYEKPFRPQVAVDRLKWMEKLTLQGMVMTSPREDARVLVQGPGKDFPLLVVGSHGLGRVLAWTSGLNRRWAEGILGHSEYDRWWQWMMEQVRPQATGDEFHLEYRERTQTLILEGWRQGKYLNQASLQIDLGRGGRISLKQRAPGRYRGHLPPLDPGLYPLVVVEGSRRLWVSALLVPPRERPHLGPNWDLLHFLSRHKVQPNLPPPGGMVRETRSGSPWLILGALFLFLLSELIGKWRG